jgi:hypothetical protein
MHRARQKAAGYGDAARDLVQRTRALDTAIGHYNKACREAGELLAAYNADLRNRRYFQPDPNDLHGDLQRLGQAMTQERDALREQLAGLEETPDNQPRRDRLQERIELLELMAKAPDSARAALDDAGAALDASIRGVGAGAGALRGQHATYLQGKRGFNLGKGADLGLQVGATAGVGASAWSQGASVATLSTKAVAWVARRPDLATTVVASHGAVVGSAVLSPIVVTYTARAAWRDTRASFRHGAVADSAERLGRQQRRLADEQDNRALRAAAAGHAPAAADAAERARDHRELAQIAGQIKRRQQTWGLRFRASANLVVATGAGLSSYAALATAGVLTACAAVTPVGLALAAVGGLALVGYGLYRWHRNSRMQAQADAAQRTLEQLPQNLNDPNFRYRPGDDADLDALVAQRTGFAADDPSHPATVDTLRGMQRTAMQTLLRCDPDYAARRLVERLQQENDLRQGATAGFLRQLGVPDDELRSVMDAATDAARADAAALLGDRLNLGG